MTMHAVDDTTKNMNLSMGGCLLVAAMITHASGHDIVNHRVIGMTLLRIMKQQSMKFLAGDCLLVAAANNEASGA